MQILNYQDIINIAHPLVLGLGQTENKLTKKYGIVWSDSASYQIAQKFHPDLNIQPYSIENERVLFAFYRMLWKTYPKQMLNIYFKKGQLATRIVLDGLLKKLNQHTATGGVLKQFLIIGVMLLLPAMALVNGWCFLHNISTNRYW